jgi:hypothetical protein
LSAFGGCGVGMIAKWSEIFVLSKIRLFGLIHLFLMISLACGRSPVSSASASIVALTVSI